MNLSWANQFAKTALKTAQQKIDSVLDIRPGDEVHLVPRESSVSDESFIASAASLDVQDETNVLAPSPSSVVAENWSNTWNSLSSDRELVVDSEPNPIRDECPQTAATLFDHSPSSNSSDGVNHGQSPEKATRPEGIKNECINNIVESVYVDVDLSIPSPDNNQFASSSETIQEENVLPPLPDIAIRNSHQDDSLTVASSDIEVIRNVDACSIASSKPTTDNVPFHFSIFKNESAESFRAQLLHAEQRRNELKAANDTLQSNNAQLQQRISVLNQQQVALKKELDEKKTELADLLTEGKRLSDHSGKQAREIRRLKNELTELQKVKQERKRLKDEKMRAEETIELQREEITSLKGMVKQLEGKLGSMAKEQSQRLITTEVAQKHALEQNKHVADLGRQLDEALKQIDDLSNLNKKLVKETEMVQSANWSERLAGERANETAATISAELQEARSHIQRLDSQLKSAESRLDSVLNERNNVALSIFQANVPLLEEINILKQALNQEKQASEEADLKMRSSRKELDAVQEQVELLRSKNDSLVAHHLQELTLVNQKVQHLEREVARLQKEKETLLFEHRSAHTADARVIEELREQTAAFVTERASLQINLKELMNENDLLKKTLLEVRSRPVEAPNQGQRYEDFSSTEDSDFAEFALRNSRTAPFSLVTPSDLLNTKYEMSAKKPDFLEQEAMRCVQLEEQVRQLEKSLQILTSQYNDLLEVDGERLERIEELEHDVFDLRQLIKEQLIAFADANMKLNAEKKKP